MIALLLVIGGWLLYPELSAQQVTVEVGADEMHHFSFRTRAATVGEALREQGIVLDTADRVSPPPQTHLSDGMHIRVEKAHQLLLAVDDETQRIYTHATNPLDILAEQGIQLAADDVLLVDYQALETEAAASQQTVPRHIAVVTARSVTLLDGQERITLGATTAQTVGDVLAEAGLILYRADTITPPLDTPVQDGMTISIERSQPVAVAVDGAALNTRAVGDTVGDVLAMLGLYLVGADYTIPAAHTPFESGMRIEVVRVVETIETEQEPLPYSTVEIPDDSLTPGEHQVVRTGQDGLIEIRYRVRLENERVVNRTEQSRWVVQAPVPQIVRTGPTP